MTVIPVHDALIDENDSAVKLARYAQLIGLSEDQFFGLNNPSTASPVACNNIWTHAERARLAKYLREAQDEIEQVTRYPLSPRWFLDEQHYYGFPVHTNWGKVIQVGFPHTTIIAAASVISHATDPAVVGPVATTVTDEDEIKVYHPGTTIEIIPSSVSIAGGLVTIQIPRARLVKTASQDNPATGYAYADIPPSLTSPFESTVTVSRVYNDDSIQGGLFWMHRTSANCTCNCSACCATCGAYSVTACVAIRNPETGAVDVLDGTYSGGSWTHPCTACYCDDPTYLVVNYRAGLDPLTMQAEDAIIRLCHAKMPLPPCGCGVVQEMWTRDRAQPDVLSAERLNCSFGVSQGAWTAWRFAHAMKLQMGLALG